jgi:SAM-dependent methyltransferase
VTGSSKGGRLRAAARTWLRSLPSPIQDRLRQNAYRMPVAVRHLLGTSDPDHPPGTVRFGSLRRTTPFSRSWGYDRGTPIDRVYIEQFLTKHAADVRGSCLEILNADYTHRFGGGRVASSDVLDIDTANPSATVFADLDEPDSLPAARFDCIIFTQTLHLVPDMRTAVANIWRSLAAGGVLLLTVPAIGRHEARKGFHHDRWRVTKTGLEWLLAGVTDAPADVTTYGNVLSCVAFLYGMAAEELRREELQVFDREFPLIVAARVAKERAR